MTFKQITLAALIVISVTESAQAQDADTQGIKTEDNQGLYAVGGGILYNSEHYGIEAKLGYNFNTYFGVEAQGSISLNTDSTRLSDSPTSATLRQKVDYSIGAFGVARLPLTKKFNVFARAGVHNTQTSSDINNALMTNLDETETNYAVGGGAQFNFDQKNGVRAEYTYLGGLGGGTASLGYVRKF